MRGIIANIASGRLDVLGVQELDFSAVAFDAVGRDGGFGRPGCAVEILFVFGQGEPGVAGDCWMFFDELEGGRLGVEVEEI